MKHSTVLGCLLAAASASPLAVRQSTAITDADILNYALTLEHLEDVFYREGLANFTAADFAAAGFDETVYNNFKEVSLDESTHVSFLTSALTAAGATPVSECTYAFGVQDVASFVATASILEGVGVTAYLGAAADIMSKTYLTAAGSILTTEARHNAYIRAALKELPYPQPFDVPLTLPDVFSLAAGFIVSCPSSTSPPAVKTFPTLAVSSTGTFVAGSVVTMTTPGYQLVSSDGSELYAAFITVTGPIFTPVTVTSSGYEITIPAGVNGQSYVVLSTCSEAVSDDTTVAIGIVEISNPTFVAAS
ncbi:putative ferritin ribonucleotide reductase-like protein [Phaeomoniella chlamydospora]|uniref:Putative ferritin ribonucleotide reductase-like protein n=1 Tax=Phaeomoniella chlamydospora TaxID=158046 RepID=A0A0G2ERH7_PHACM|nr:putative ferritin ribonucleotide reductase-like protein [Phaeomoniella chlamydospora]